MKVDGSGFRATGSTRREAIATDRETAGQLFHGNTAVDAGGGGGIQMFWIRSHDRILRRSPEGVKADFVTGGTQ